MDPAQGWAPRRGFARILRIAAFLLPIALSIIFAFVLVGILPAPATPGQTAGWWATLAIAVVLFSMGTDQLFSRLLPAASLLELSLTFPDATPSRFRAAMKTRSVRSLQREIANGNLDPLEAPTEAAQQLIEMANALTLHDRATRGHTERVRAYSLLIGEEMGLNPEELEKLRWAAMIHDVGKLKVSADILNSEGRPTDAEWEELSQHPLYGAEYAEPLRDWLGQWVDAAGQHHEKWDGTGYPLGLSGKNISLGGRIVAVADAFDVMTSVRSYKEGMADDAAKAELARCAGKQFDPDVVKAMLRVSIPKRRLTGAAWFAQLPIVGNVFPNGGVVAVSTVSAAIAAVTLTPGPFEPQLIAYSNLSTAEDTVLVVEITEDPQPDRVTILSVDGPATAEWNGSAIVITGMPNANGIITVDYEACWEQTCVLGSTTAEFTPVNDDPTALDDIIMVTEEGPVRLSPLANDSDLDQDTIALESAEVTNGQATARVDANEIIVMPTIEAAQTVDLDYTIVDGFGGKATASARVFFPDFNEAPTVEGESAEVLIGQVVVVDVLSNDMDPSGDALSLSGIVAGSDLGSAEITGDTIEFTAGDTPGVAEVTYEVSDGRATTEGVLEITVLAPPPSIADDRLRTREDNAASVDVIANDVAPGSTIDSTSLTIQSASLGSAVHVGNGIIRFTPTPDAYGVGSVSYSVCNAAGSCSSGTVLVEIERVNDIPSFSAGPDVTAPTSSSYSAPWASNGSVGEANEPDQTLGYLVTVDNPDLFVVAPSISATGVLSFSTADAPGVATIEVRASDGIDTSAPATFTITVG